MQSPVFITYDRNVRESHTPVSNIAIHTLYVGGTSSSERSVEMRPGTRHILPLVQTVVAVALLWWSARWWEVQGHLQDTPVVAPGVRLLFALNAPLIPLRLLWSQILPPLWDDASMVVTIALLWYLVAKNIASWREQRKVFIFSQLPLRLVADGILICDGAFLLLYFIGGVRWLLMYPSRMLIYPSRMVAWLLLVLPLCWSFVLIFFFARDFVRCLRRRFLGPERTAV